MIGCKALNIASVSTDRSTRWAGYCAHTVAVPGCFQSLRSKDANRVVGCKALTKLLVSIDRSTCWGGCCTHTVAVSSRFEFLGSRDVNGVIGCKAPNFWFPQTEARLWAGCCAHAVAEFGRIQSPRSRDVKRVIGCQSFKAPGFHGPKDVFGPAAVPIQSLCPVASIPPVDTVLRLLALSRASDHNRLLTIRRESLVLHALSSLPFVMGS